MTNYVAEGEPLFYCWEVRVGYTAQVSLHTHSFHEFYFSFDGTGEQLTARQCYRMSAGDLYLFPAGQGHIARSELSEEISGIVLYCIDQLFTPNLEGDADLHRIMRYLLQRAASHTNLIALSDDGRRRVRHSLAMAAQEFRRKAPGYRGAARTRIQEMLLAVLRDHETPLDLTREFKPVRGVGRLADVRLFLQTHYMYPISVEQVLELAHLSRSQFHALFKAETGYTLTAYVNAVRLTAAEQMLRDTTASVTEVASHCGFTCLSHFYHLFRTHFGITPQAMRGRRG